jgi:hypothetical protein
MNDCPLRVFPTSYGCHGAFDCLSRPLQWRGEWPKLCALPPPWPFACSPGEGFAPAETCVHTRPFIWCRPAPVQPLPVLFSACDYALSGRFLLIDELTSGALRIYPSRQDDDGGWSLARSFMREALERLPLLPMHQTPSLPGPYTLPEEPEEP